MVRINHDKSKDYVLKLKRNLFGQKQAGRVWNKHLVKALEQVGFVTSNVDECLFYKGKVIFVLYTDDSILTGPNPKELDNVVQDMKKAGLNLTVEGNINDFLGVQIQRETNNFHFSQPHLVLDILKELRLDGEKTAVKQTPTASSRQL